MTFRQISIKYIDKFSSWDMLPDSPAEVCVMGRSNSGKSSFIRSISGQKKSIHVSSTPGATKKLFYYESPGFSLVDLPGYGYAKIAHSYRDFLSGMIGNYLLNRPNIIKIYVTMDIRREITDEEVQLLDFMETRKIDNRDFSFIFILTKTDKLNQKDYNKRMKYFEFKKNELGIDEIYPVSNLTLKGYEKVMESLLR